MSDGVRGAVAGQFLAAIDMLANAIDACPDSLWDDASREPRFWYVAHHTLFWLDGYLSDSLASYRPPAPFGLEELDPAGVMPPRAYSREELRAWLGQVRATCADAVAALTETSAREPANFPRLGLSRLELHLYNLRHVQHHTGQLQMMLRHAGVEPPRWVKRGAGA